MVGENTLSEVQPETVARIGPNALIQTVQAIREQHDEATLLAILEVCGQENLRDESPEHMIDERLFADLVAALVRITGPEASREVLHRSGELTAGYLLENRIPGFFQQLLRVLPWRWALAALLLAIRQHAWTFTGSGRFAYHLGDRPILTVECPIEPGDVTCSFYSGTFTRLLQTLVDPRLQVSSTTSQLAEFTLCRYPLAVSQQA